MGASGIQWKSDELLRMIKDCVATSFHLEIYDLDLTPFDALDERGRIYQLFGYEMNIVISELNEALTA